ncbi:AGL343Cp [Eremothecium gossypii ATCC 10895]|uniref:glucan 1,3-beta-glucosidase n=1 Tax=Eremothecium gossypii (strain ATCC 10895 / CBS 109.51 / FGSC 9923 / NRRL Y-1056) TaxID=284811 RepID=Q751R4_EREGS|nr:AGL343Cp [Eremothecium gossypii ATCC 10895]AAS54148.2 AGL343Cp [Eremothecium gossypii ATCC 10895]AEY98474.1 FAGL343Cp [Eremothecium gossypii FDAG1]
MRFSATVSAALLGASSVHAMGDLAFNLGVKKHDGTCKYTQDYLDDFEALRPYTDTVKVYSTSDCNTLQFLGPAADRAGFKLWVGVWPDDDAHFSMEKDALKTYLPWIKSDTVRGFLVGSEALYRDDMPAEDLAKRINEVRNFVKDIKDINGNSFSGKPVGTVDSWNVIVDGRSRPVIEASDLVMANAFSYWQGQTMQNASYSFFDDIMQALQTVQTVKGSSDISFYVGETGWPTEGSSFETSQPSLENAKQFWKEGICAMRSWGINTIVFEAFDEDWKPDTSGISDVEKHWGVFTADRKPKFNLSCD